VSGTAAGVPRAAVVSGRYVSRPTPPTGRPRDAGAGAVTAPG